MLTSILFMCSPFLRADIKVSALPDKQVNARLLRKLLPSAVTGFSTEQLTSKIHPQSRCKDYAWHWKPSLSFYSLVKNAFLVS